LRFIDGELQNGEEVYNVGSDEEQEKEELTEEIGELLTKSSYYRS